MSRGDDDLRERESRRYLPEGTDRAADLRAIGARQLRQLALQDVRSKSQRAEAKYVRQNWAEERRVSREREVAAIRDLRHEHYGVRVQPFKEQVWDRLGTDRRAVLEKLEAELAAIAGRDPIPFRFVTRKQAEHELKWHSSVVAQYDHDKRIIIICTDVLADQRRTVAAYLEEQFHAKQFSVMDDAAADAKGREDAWTRQMWQNGWEHYPEMRLTGDPKHDKPLLERYFTNRLELDARRYVATIMGRLDDGTFF